MNKILFTNGTTPQSPIVPVPSSLDRTTAPASTIIIPPPTPEGILITSVALFIILAALSSFWRTINGNQK